MADRYLRATGNWNGAVWAATPGGTAGSASTPTIDDEVTIGGNFTVTLTANASAATILHTNGTVALSSHKLTVDSNFVSSGTTSRTINLGSGTLEFTGDGQPEFQLTGSNLTLNAGSSLVIFNQKLTIDSSANHFATGNKTFNDVRILMGGTSNSTTFNITGSPTFRSLIIQSKNSAAHTVNFDGESVKVDKFIAIGSSANNRLKLSGAIQHDTYLEPASQSSTSYGQFLDINYLHPDYWHPHLTPYVGSNSIGVGEWIYQDPPKISTLVDPLTTAPGSNPNWTVSGTVTQVTSGVKGGGYKFADFGNIISTDTFDLLDSEVIFEVPPTPLPPDFLYGEVTINREYSGSALSLNAADSFDGSKQRTTRENRSGHSEVFLGNLWDYPTTTTKYMKFALSAGGLVTAEVSDDGNSWVVKASEQLDEVEIALLRSCRIVAGYNGWALGSINPSLVPPNNANFLQFFI